MPLFPAYPGDQKKEKPNEPEIWSVTKTEVKVELEVFQNENLVEILSDDDDDDDDEGNYRDASVKKKRKEHSRKEPKDTKKKKKEKKYHENDRTSRKKDKKSDKESTKKSKKHKHSRSRSSSALSSSPKRHKPSKAITTKAPQATTSPPCPPPLYSIITTPDNDTLQFESVHHPPVYRCRFKDFDELNGFKNILRYFSTPVPMPVDGPINRSSNNGGSNDESNNNNIGVDFIEILADNEDEDKITEPNDGEIYHFNLDYNITNTIPTTCTTITTTTTSTTDTTFFTNIPTTTVTTTSTTITNVDSCIVDLSTIPIPVYNNTTTNNTNNNITNNTTTNNNINIPDKYKDYTDRLGRNKYDLALWIEFVHFQKFKFEFDTKGAKKQKQQNTRKLVAELKLAVINDAIAKNKERFEVTKWREKNKKINYKKKHLFNELLLMRMQMVGVMAMGVEEVVEEWQGLVREWNEVVLWKSYLAYMRVHSGSTDEVVLVYARCIKSVQKHDDDVLLDILSELLDFLLDSGYSEMVTSIYQLLIGLNVDPPPLLEALPLDDKLEFLAAYWASGVGGCGEKNWVAYKEWVQNKGVVGGGEAGDDDDDINGGGDDDDDKEWEIISSNHNQLSLLWNQLERLRSSRHFVSFSNTNKKKNSNKNKIVGDDNDKVGGGDNDKVGEDDSDKVDGGDDDKTGGDDNDEEEEEDEGRVVAFEEVSAFLFEFKSRESSFKIIIMYTLYLIRHSSAWCTLCYVCDVCAGVKFGGGSDDNCSSGHDNSSGGPDSSGGDDSDSVGCFVRHHNSIFDHLHLLPHHSAVQHFTCTRPQFNSTHTHTLLTNIFTFTRTQFPQYKRAINHLCLTYQIHHHLSLATTKTTQQKRSIDKEIKNIFKSMLKDDADDVGLWLRYAIFETTSGNLKLALKVIKNNLHHLGSAGADDDDTTISTANTTNENNKNKKKKIMIMMMRHFFDFTVGVEESVIRENCSIYNNNNYNIINNDKDIEEVLSELVETFRPIDTRLRGPIMVDKLLDWLSKQLYDVMKSSDDIDDGNNNNNNNGNNKNNKNRDNNNYGLITHISHLVARVTFMTTKNLADVMSFYQATIDKVVDNKGVDAKFKNCILRSLVAERWDFLKMLKKKEDCHQSIIHPSDLSIMQPSDPSIIHPSDPSITHSSPIQSPNPSIHHHLPSPQLTSKIMTTIAKYDLDLLPFDPIVASHFYHVTSLTHMIGPYNDHGNNDVIKMAYAVHLLRRLLLSHEQAPGIKNKLKNYLEKCISNLENNNTNNSTNNNTTNSNNNNYNNISNNNSSINYWFLYILLHACSGEGGRVKEVFYRCVQQHPYNKLLYMQCQALEPSLLVTMTTVMMRRRMRVRTLLEELMLLSHAHQLLPTNQEKAS